MQGAPHEGPSRGTSLRANRFYFYSYSVMCIDMLIYTHLPCLPPSLPAACCTPGPTRHSYPSSSALRSRGMLVQDITSLSLLLGEKGTVVKAQVQLQQKQDQSPAAIFRARPTRRTCRTKNHHHASMMISSVYIWRLQRRARTTGSRINRVVRRHPRRLS